VFRSVVQFATIVHADGSHVGRVLLNSIYVSTFVGLFFSHDISKRDAASITKLDIDIFHHESWKSILGSKGQRSRS